MLVGSINVNLLWWKIVFAPLGHLLKFFPAAVMEITADYALILEWGSSRPISFMIHGLTAVESVCLVLSDLSASALHEAPVHNFSE